jgi:hypothetical protein
MPLRSSDDEYDDFEHDFDEDPDDGDPDEDVATIGCPYCGEEIYEDANWCPCCTNYISREDVPPPRRSWWLVAGVIVCLTIVASWFLIF